RPACALDQAEAREDIEHLPVRVSVPMRDHAGFEHSVHGDIVTVPVALDQHLGPQRSSGDAFRGAPDRGAGPVDGHPYGSPSRFAFRIAAHKSPYAYAASIICASPSAKDHSSRLVVVMITMTSSGRIPGASASSATRRL